MLRAVALGDLHLNGHDFLAPYVSNPQDLIYRLLAGVVRYARQNGIRYIFQLGDVFHSPSPSQADQKRLLDFIERSGLMWFVQLGNHDIAENKRHSLILSEFVAVKMPKNLRVITQPTTFTLEGVPICILPWPHSKTLLTKPGLTFAHITLKGIRLDSGMRLKDKGVEITDKKGYWIIGDVHAEQRIGNWAHYIGTPCQRTFGEALPKGFSDVRAKVENGRLIVKDEFIVRKPPYELVNLAVDCDDDLEKLKPFDLDDLTLYKLKIGNGYQLPAQFRRDNPHVAAQVYEGKKKTAVAADNDDTAAIATQTEFDDPLRGLDAVFAARNLTAEQRKRGFELARKMVARR